MEKRRLFHIAFTVLLLAGCAEEPVEEESSPSEGPDDSVVVNCTETISVDESFDDFEARVADHSKDNAVICIEPNVTIFNMASDWIVVVADNVTISGKSTSTFPFFINYRTSGSGNNDKVFGGSPKGLNLQYVGLAAAGSGQAQILDLGDPGTAETLSLDHVYIDGGGDAGAIITAANWSVDVDHSTIVSRYGGSMGGGALWTQGPTLVTNSDISCHNQACFCLNLTGGTATVSNNWITVPSGVGIGGDTSSTYNISNNIITTGQEGISSILTGSTWYIDDNLFRRSYGINANDSTAIDNWGGDVYSQNTNSFCNLNSAVHAFGQYISAVFNGTFDQDYQSGIYRDFIPNCN